MKIYVIRHGLTELNKKKVLNGQIDEPLASEGLEQAKNAATLVPKTIKYIYTSPMLRAKKTAEVINEELSLSTSSHDGLKEINMGSLAGKSWGDLEMGAELKEKRRSVQFDYRSSGGESAEEVKARLIGFLKEINERHQDDEVLLVTHGGIIRILHLLERDKPLQDEMENAILLTFDLDKILKEKS